MRTIGPSSLSRLSSRFASRPSRTSSTVELTPPPARTGEPARLVLHIGTPKSATTFLQAQLRASRSELHSRGWLYPGEEYLPDKGLNQQPAMYGIAGPGVDWASEAVRASGRRYMHRLQREIAQNPVPTLVSAEVLSSFRVEEIPVVMSSLGFTPEQTQVIITARDLGRMLGSIWQQNVKNGAKAEQGSYLRGVAAQRASAESSFWAAYSAPRLVARWAEHVGAERITVVPVPYDRTMMWPRFTEAVGLSDLPELHDVIPAKDRNISLSQSQVEMLRHLNVVLEKEYEDPAQRRRLRKTLLTAWMSNPPAGAPGTRLNPEIAAQIGSWAEEDLALLREQEAAGLRVVGDLKDLLPRATRTDREEGQESEVTTLDLAADLLSLLKYKAPQRSVRR